MNTTEAQRRAAAFKARLREVSNQTCPECGSSTTKAMLAYLGTCSGCHLAAHA